MAQGKVLIIDDEEEVREVLALHLKKGGFEAIEAKDGAEAIQLMKKGSNLVNVGLIICDIRMPKVNGVEAIDFLRENAASVPILVVTGYPDTELAVSLIGKGVKDYLVKPVSKEKLLKTVSRIFSEEQDFQYA
jgi:two-component system, chemotaxis family, chemotaxis protein CheY